MRRQGGEKLTKIIRKLVEPIESPIPRKLPVTIPDDEMPLQRSPIRPDLSRGMPRSQSVSDEIQAKLDALNQPPTRKQSLLRGLSEAAPIAVGGLLGGSEGAYGASQGVEQGMAEQTRQRETQRKTLEERLATQLQREFQGEQGAYNRQMEAATLAETIARQNETERHNRATEGREAQRNLDPLSPAGIAARLELERRTPRNLDPNSPEGIAARLDFEKQRNQLPPNAIATQRAGTAAQNASTSAQRLGLSKDQFDARAFGTNQGEPLPGALVTEQGQPVGSSFSQNVRPTAQQRNKADMGVSAKEQLDDIRSIVRTHPEIFGPVQGRTTDISVWVGSQDPDAQRFLTARTIAGDHLAGTFGGRSEAALEALDKAIGQFKDNPAAMEAGLEQINRANDIFIKQGTVRTVGSGAAPKSSGMVRVKIPGHPAGQIPAAQLQIFLRENPGARQVQ